MFSLFCGEDMFMFIIFMFFFFDLILLSVWVSMGGKGILNILLLFFCFIGFCLCLWCFKFFDFFLNIVSCVWVFRSFVICDICFNWEIDGMMFGWFMDRVLFDVMESGMLLWIDIGIIGIFGRIEMTRCSGWGGWGWCNLGLLWGFEVRIRWGLCDRWFNVSFSSSCCFGIDIRDGILGGNWFCMVIIFFGVEIRRGCRGCSVGSCWRWGNDLGRLMNIGWFIISCFCGGRLFGCWVVNFGVSMRSWRGICCFVFGNIDCGGFFVEVGNRMEGFLRSFWLGMGGGGGLGRGEIFCMGSFLCRSGLIVIWMGLVVFFNIMGWFFVGDFFILIVGNVGLYVYFFLNDLFFIFLLKFLCFLFFLVLVFFLRKMFFIFLWRDLFFLGFFEFVKILIILEMVCGMGGWIIFLVGRGGLRVLFLFFVW